MITKLQEAIIRAVNVLYYSESKIGETAFVKQVSKELGRELSHLDFSLIKEACLDLQRKGVFREVDIGDTSIINKIVPNYGSIAIQELQRLEKTAQWKERLVGAFFTLLLWGLKELIMLLT